MSKKRMSVVIVTALLSLMGLSNVVYIIVQHHRLIPDYTAFCLLGLAGAFATYKLKPWGRWLLIIFYTLQLVRIISPGFKFNYVSGISFYIGVFEGNTDTFMNQPVGVQLNLLALLMLFLCILWTKKAGHNKN